MKKCKLLTATADSREMGSVFWALIQRLSGGNNLDLNTSVTLACKLEVSYSS